MVIMSLFIGVITMEMFSAVQAFENEQGDIEYQENLRKNREDFKEDMATFSKKYEDQNVRIAKIYRFKTSPDMFYWRIN